MRYTNSTISLLEPLLSDGVHERAFLNVLVIEEAGRPIGVELAFGVNMVLVQTISLAPYSGRSGHGSRNAVRTTGPCSDCPASGPPARARCGSRQR
ncbi:hypothetical protein [Streptomyces sp. NBC_01727]|uniref:hypothetical protein n=1 Tax=Streptomyces sp. NBC_01727 TaxID=2975924 RepID=UPI002E107F3B|nr:hypothetical protein OIE76_40615 [Streptomyces sp. NBC_01727]